MLNCRFDRRDNGGDVARQLGAVVGDVDRGFHRAALLVTEHHDQCAPEHDRRVLDAADDDRVRGGVAGDAHHEEVAEALVEDDLSATRESEQLTIAANGAWPCASSALRTPPRRGLRTFPQANRRLPFIKRVSAAVGVMLGSTGAAPTTSPKASSVSSQAGSATAAAKPAEGTPKPRRTSRRETSASPASGAVMRCPVA